MKPSDATRTRESIKFLGKRYVCGHGGGSNAFLFHKAHNGQCLQCILAGQAKWQRSWLSQRLCKPKLDKKCQHTSNS